MKTVLIIYFSGFIVVWIIHKLSYKDAQEWNNVRERLIFSLFSWIALILVLAVQFSYWLSKRLGKPPKWL